MSVEEINYRNNIELILTGIAKGVGVEITHSSERKQSNSFREQMKQKQQKRQEVKKENGR